MSTIMASVSAIGQDSHRFETVHTGKKLLLGGYEVDAPTALAGNSDADVVLHAVTNAVSGLTGVNILGARADKMCLEQGITDSAVYLAEALTFLGDMKLIHLSITVECCTPRLSKHVDGIKDSLSNLTGIPASSIGLTATSGEGLTSFGRGEGIQAFVIITALKPVLQ